MEPKATVKENIVIVEYGEEFAIFNRIPDPEEQYGLTISFPATLKFADDLEKSGIIEVISLNESGTLIFKKKPFFETHLFCDVLFNQLEKHIMKEKHNLYERE